MKLIKTVSKVFHEEAIGINMIIMMIIAGVYIYTESPSVQKIGFCYVLLMVALTIGYLLKLIVMMTIGFSKYIKSKFKSN